MANESLIGALWQTLLTMRKTSRERRAFGGFHPLEVECLACGMPRHAPCSGERYCLQRIGDAATARGLTAPATSSEWPYDVACPVCHAPRGVVCKGQTLEHAHRGRYENSPGARAARGL